MLDSNDAILEQAAEDSQMTIINQESEGQATNQMGTMDNNYSSSQNHAGTGGSSKMRPRPY